MANLNPTFADVKSFEAKSKHYLSQGNITEAAYWQKQANETRNQIIDRAEQASEALFA